MRQSADHRSLGLGLLGVEVGGAVGQELLAVLVGQGVVGLGLLDEVRNLVLVELANELSRVAAPQL